MSQSVSASKHYDPYKEDLGEGEPLYDAWAIEDDKEGTHFHNELISAGRNGFQTPAGRPSTNELWRFRRRGIQDCWALVFFVAFILCLLLWGVTEIHRLELSQTLLDRIALTLGSEPIKVEDFLPHSDGKGSSKASKDAAFADGEEPYLKSFTAIKAGIYLMNPPSSEEEVTLGYKLLFLIWTGIALIATTVGLLLLESIPRALINTECYVQSIIMAICGIYTIGQGSVFYGILLLSMSSLPLLFLYYIQDRLEFSAVMLTCTAKILRRHKGIFVLALLMALLTVGFSIFSIYLLLPPILRGLGDEAHDFDSSYILLLIFGVFWVQEVIRNVMHVTSCGVVATWYFAGESRLPPSPIKASFLRATTTSIGSICFGSLLVSIIRFLRFLVESSRSSNDDSGLLTCVLDAVLSIIESIATYFNEYAFVHIAIYGCSYIDAAKKTWALTKQCFFAAIFNDCLAGMAADILTFMIAICVGIASGILTWSVSFGVIIFIVSLFINVTAFQVVQSAVTTIFVCFAELPEGLEISFPSLYTVLITTDRGYTHSTQDYRYGSV